MRGKRGENADVPSAPHMAKSCHAIVILWLDRLAQRSRRLIGVPRFNVQVQVTLCARHKYGYLWDSLSPDQIWCFQLLTTPRDCGFAPNHRSQIQGRVTSAPCASDSESRYSHCIQGNHCGEDIYQPSFATSFATPRSLSYYGICLMTTHVLMYPPL